MSVAGVDIGNSNSCVALARKRGIDVLMNKESKRETPSVVSFSDKQRAIGTDGAARMTTNLKSTVTEIKRLIGKKFDDPSVQRESSEKVFRIVGSADNQAMVEVFYQNQWTKFLPEQVLAMQIIDLKHIVDMEQGSPVQDYVLSVPVYFGENERYAVLNATRLAGINCLQFINETTAAALSYGIYKPDLSDKETYVAFVDVGHASTQVSIVSFLKSQLEVKSHAWDANLGGRDFDAILFDHFSKQFQQKYGLDVRESPKASLRLRVGCEKVKKILSGITEAQQMIESLMDDRDFELRITREEFENMSAELLARLEKPLQEVLQLAGVEKKKLASVELFGGGSRIPAVQVLVKNFFEQEPSRTLHQKEVVCRGCALQCAIQSPSFKVKEFAVQEWYTGNIVLCYNKDDGSTAEMAIYKRGDHVFSKLFKVAKSTPGNLFIKAEMRYPDGSSQLLGEYEVGPITIPEGCEKTEVRVRTQLDLYGLFRVQSAWTSYQEEYEEVVEVKGDASQGQEQEQGQGQGQSSQAQRPEPMNTENENDQSQENVGDAEMETEREGEQEGGDKAQEGGASNEASNQKQQKRVEIVKKKRQTKIDFPLKTKFVMGMDENVFNHLLEHEGYMRASDRQHIETSEARNEFEAYIYNLRNGLQGKLREFAKESDCSQLIQELDKWENWLYEEGEDEQKSVYVDKLKMLQQKGEPIMFRSSEFQSREKAKTELESRCRWYQQSVTSNAPELAHISAEDKDKVLLECQSALQWIMEKWEVQQKMPKWDKPLLLTEEINRKSDVVSRVCEQILNQPPPKKEEEKKPEDKGSEEQKQQQQQQQNQTSTMEEGEQEGGKNNITQDMDVDG
eukprot:TRINITY_DN1741_c0_g1_i4.p1 TRINITY_DN1741_c0_g1~~TRINITY_DN1741_c0_g1_i4.p1  ORF type:complete len:857 (-),score=177.71 TRINITY_DN1741_c0_g1_i4:190-2739(-)